MWKIVEKQFKHDENETNSHRTIFTVRSEKSHGNSTLIEIAYVNLYTISLMMIQTKFRCIAGLSSEFGKCLYNTPRLDANRATGNSYGL